MCGVTEKKLKDLAIPFNPKALRWRVGATNGAKTKGMALPYVEARHVQHRLDEVCGIGSWANEYKAGPVGGLVCGISILIKSGDEMTWVTKWDGSGGTGGDEDIKGGISDSFKRASVVWGIARYLYALPKFWVEIEPMGKSYKFKAGEIDKILSSKFPKWALPGDNGKDPDPDDDIGEDLDKDPVPVGAKADPEAEQMIQEMIDDGAIVKSSRDVPAGVSERAPISAGDWDPVSKYVVAHPDLQGSDVAMMRKDHGEDAQVIYQILLEQFPQPVSA